MFGRDRPRADIACPVISGDIADMANEDLKLVANGVHYLSQGDETSFFGWLQRIDCVRDVRGVGHSLVINLSDLPTDEDLRELIGLFYRYDIDMRQLAGFADREWVRNPNAFWYERLFA